MRTNWKNLAPNLIRQRIIIELLTNYTVGPDEILDYLTKLSETVGMHMLSTQVYEAVINEEFVGYGGWIHWVTSGAHVYSYTIERTKTNGKALFSVDAYTCKPFSIEAAVQFTKDYFKINEIVWQEV